MPTRVAATRDTRMRLTENPSAGAFLLQRGNDASMTASEIPDFFQSMISSAVSGGLGRLARTYDTMTSAPTPSCMRARTFSFSTVREAVEVAVAAVAVVAGAETAA